MNEINEPTTQSLIAQWAGAAAAGAVALTVGVQKILRSWTSDRAAITEDKARIDIVQGLRDELARVRGEMHSMSERITALVNTNIQLTQEVARLSAEVHRLRAVEE